MTFSFKERFVPVPSIYLFARKHIRYVMCFLFQNVCFSSSYCQSCHSFFPDQFEQLKRNNQHLCRGFFFPQGHTDDEMQFINRLPCGSFQYFYILNLIILRNSPLLKFFNCEALNKYFSSLFSLSLCDLIFL